MRPAPHAQGADQLERARLAFISASGPPLPPARHALNEEPESAGRSGFAEIQGGSAVTKSEAEPLREPASWRSLTIPMPAMRLERNHVVVILLALLGAVGIAVVSLTRSAASEVPLDVVSVAAPSASPSMPEPTPSPPPVRVHVLGAVAEPGVVSLAEGAIVLDAIEAAGGLTPEAATGDLNLAAGVADGQQLVVGTTASPGGQLNGAGPPAAAGPDPGGGADAGTLLDLNKATQAQLEDLPGVGPVLASAILTWREEHQKFSSVAELQEVDGIGPKSFAKLEPLVTV